MSYAIDHATTLHQRNVAAVSALQSLVVKAVDTLSGVTDQAPHAPEKLSRTLDAATAPVAKAVGTPSEMRAFAVASYRDWVEVQHRFQTALLDAMTSSTQTVEASQQAAGTQS